MPITELKFRIAHELQDLMMIVSGQPCWKSTGEGQNPDYVTPVNDREWDWCVNELSRRRIQTLEHYWEIAKLFPTPSKDMLVWDWQTKATILFKWLDYRRSLN